MVKPHLRSRSLKRKKVRTPGKRLTTHYKSKKPGVAKCAICKKRLHGIPRLNQADMRKLAKTKKRPQRPYGGNLCSKCMRNLFKKSVTEILEKK
jgi:large subunit ribosomal protein L34e